jgi:hypothetical protein
MEPKKRVKKLEGFKIDPLLGTPRIYRYMMEFPMGNIMFNWLVDCELPSIRMNRNLEGTYLTEWNPIQIKFRELFGEVNNQNEFYRRVRDWFADYNYTRQKINTTIHRIDPVGISVDRWDLRGCFISAIHYSNAYTDDNIPELEITMHYDFCNYHLLSD